MAQTSSCSPSARIYGSRTTAHILAAANMDFHDVVKLSVYVTDKAHFEEFSRARTRHMKDHKPGATMLVVGPFPRAGIEAEVEAIAAKLD